MQNKKINYLKIMKFLIQRVKKSELYINKELYSSINSGYLVYIGISKYDSNPKIDEIMVSKLLNQRLFEDSEGKINLSIQDVGGDIMVVSNFTLYGDAKKGTRPSFTDAAKPDEAKIIYERFMKNLRNSTNLNVQEGQFQAMMEVNSVNDGPINLIIHKEIE